MNSQFIVQEGEQTQPNSRLVGYAHVSTDDQDLSLQIDALTEHKGTPRASMLASKKLIKRGIWRRAVQLVYSN